TISLAAIGGGVFGALLTAFLSYHVQKRIKTWEENRRRARLWHVHIIQLADFIGAFGYLGEVFKSAEIFGDQQKSYTVAEQMAADKTAEAEAAKQKQEPT